MTGLWRPALRMARRDLRRHRLRSLLTCVLVAVPVVAATVAALVSYNTRYTADTAATETMRSADGVLEVSRLPEVRHSDALWLSAVPPRGADPVRRDPRSVDVASLLPPGSSLTPWPRERGVRLPSGGTATVHFEDLADPVFAGFAEVVSGRAPSGDDEVVLPRTAASELGLLDGDGGPGDGAAVRLADGSALRVVGILEDRSGYGGALDLYADPAGALAKGKAGPPRFLVELPDVADRTGLRKLSATLAAAGVTFQPRDFVLNPDTWGRRASSAFDSGPDLEHLVVGAVVMLVGLLEVVLVVGAAFAIAARRQVRDLGLLAANGGAGKDVRRVLLAQGLVLGVLSSAVGVGLGVLAFVEGVSLWERVLGTTLRTTEVDAPTLVLVGLLGAVASVVAALLPAWSISRLTPVAALSGRFPVAAGESRSHRGAFLLVGGGLLLLAGGGWLTARAFAPRRTESPLPPFITGLGLLLTVVGVIWATPYLVRIVAGAGRALPLSGRYAFRDAGRHRFRSAAAVMALTITVTAAVLSGFAFASVAQAQERQGSYQPPSSLLVYSDGDPAAVQATVERLAGPVETIRTRTLVVGSKARSTRQVLVRGDWRPVQVVDEASLALITGGDEAALEAFRAGAVVALSDTGLTGDSARLRLEGGRRSARTTLSRLPMAVVPGEESRLGDWSVGRSFVSEATAQAVGGRAAYGETLMLTAKPVTSDLLDRLAVYGIGASSEDPDRLRVEQMQYAGLVVAGLLSALVVGIAVAMASAESRDDVATLAAVGAGPWRRRSLGAMHGLFLALVGSALGLGVGTAGGLAFTQLDGLPGVDVPWVASLGTAACVLALGAVAGWVVTPSRLALTRRTA